MQLSSVRELKEQLTDTVLASFSVAENVVNTLALSAGPLSLKGAIRSLALGVVAKGKGNFHLAVRFQRRELADSKILQQIRKKAKDEIDVRYIGRVAKLAPTWEQKRQRPLQIGTSIGHHAITAGTLGAFVKRRIDGKTMLLSNNHVLANENRGKRGDNIVQPGTFDKGKRPEDVVATLEGMVKFKKRGKNFVDCAVALPTAGIEINATSIRGLGKLAGLGPEFLDEGTAVSKFGRTTGLTQGRVTAFELDNVIVAFDIGNLRFDNQIEIEGADEDAFSQGGDSGSLIVDEERNAVALLFAGGDQGGTNDQGLTYANPIRAVLDALGVDLLT